MAEISYYVYSLKDPRTSPAKPFYIGKGTGTRAYDHLVRPDDSRKGKRIREIVDAGHEALVSRLVEDLSETQAAPAAPAGVQRAEVEGGQQGEGRPRWGSAGEGR
jgi:hypothetical protein